MIFKNVIINKKIWAQLSSSYKNNKTPNAYIFSGKARVGKEIHALEYAALLNCKRSNDFSPCGDCRSCITIKMYQHEEIHFIYPVKLQKDGKSGNFIMDTKTTENLISQYELKRKNPYHKINFKTSTTISINSIRNIKKKLFLSKSDENWSIIIINEAEKLCIPNVEAANSLLKILEEPPDRTLFILITSKLNQIIPTIQSRCQKIHFPDISLSELTKYVNENKLEEFVGEPLQLCNGSLYNISENLDNEINHFMDIFNLFYSIKLEQVNNLILNFESNIKTDKKYVNRQLNYLIISIKDIMSLSIDRETSVQFNFLYNNYLLVIEQFPDADWNKIFHLLNETLVNLRSNIYTSFELHYLLFNVRYCLKGENYNTFNTQLTGEINNF